jgi:DNA-binding transcriptional LysR family regulator
MKRLRGLENTVIKIGASNIPGSYLIPAILPLFTARYPGISVAVLQGDSRETLDCLNQEEIEVGIIGTLFDDKNVDFLQLGQDKIVLAVKGNHRWAGTKPISLKEMLTERFILREAGSGTDKTVQEALARAGLRPDQIKIQASLGSNEAVKQAVRNGMGAAFISEISIGSEVARGEMTVVRVRGLTISRFFYLIRRRKRDLSPPARAWVNFLQEMYKGDLPEKGKC